MKTENRDRKNRRQLLLILSGGHGVDDLDPVNIFFIHLNHRIFPCAFRKNIGFCVSRHSTGLKNGDHNLFRMIYNLLCPAGCFGQIDLNSNSHILFYCIDSDQFLLK